ncbi:MAG TPA: G1 family glutamic endopeptidase [Solirubrobacteraceae bacterium]|nr:G1 family glutamic endopeptidase [Solirubrobacteraceae bacterium]
MRSGSARPGWGLERAPALACCVWLACVALAAQAPAANAAAAPGGSPVVVSSNWAGYAVVGSSRSVSRFTRVAGAWTQPSASCRPGAASYSAVWVGLGGFSERSRALEQIGSEADCAQTGQAVYFAWLELVPQAPVDLELKVQPGDHLAASVTVHGSSVALHITDLSTGAHFYTTRRMSSPDTSSAEWIVEAPSICVGSGACSTLALTDFGTVAFASATATGGGHTGTIDDPRWSASELELRQGDGAARGPGRRPRFAGVRTPIDATPSPPSGPDGAFSVTWGEEPLEQPSPPAVAGATP